MNIGMFGAPNGVIDEDFDMEDFSDGECEHDKFAIPMTLPAVLNRIVAIYDRKVSHRSYEHPIAQVPTLAFRRRRISQFA